MRSLFFKIFLCFWLSHLIVVSILVAILTRVQNQMEEERRPPPNTAPIVLSGWQLEAHARRAAQLFQKEQKLPEAQRRELADYLGRVQKETGSRALLYEDGRGVVAGEEGPTSQELLRRAVQSQDTEYVFTQRGLGVARAVRLPGGKRYSLALLRSSGFRRGRFGNFEGQPGGPAPGPGVGTPPSGSPPSGTPPTGTPAEGGRRFRFEGPSVQVLGMRLDRRQADGLARMVAIFLASGIVAFGLARYLTAPTVQLRRATLQLAGGDLGARVGHKMGRRRDELADLGRDFDKMAERIQALMQAERRLLGDISHELGSPLARLKLALELAQQDSAPGTQEYLTRIDREASRLDELIGQLLTLTRLETAAEGTAAGPSADLAPVSLADLVAEICSDANFEAQSQGKNVVLLTAEPCQVQGNRELLRSAIENVVRNAILHTPEKGDIQVALLRQSAEGGKNQALIQVRDHGPGVPQEALGELFRPFYRVAEARDRRSGGVGLGLSITDRAVRFHGGQVRATNHPQGGLQVELVLPLNLP